MVFTPTFFNATNSSDLFWAAVLIQPLWPLEDILLGPPLLELLTNVSEQIFLSSSITGNFSPHSLVFSGGTFSLLSEWELMGN